MRICYVLALALGLTGCATNNGLYDWGGYNGLLYQSYKVPAETPAQMQKLETHIQGLEQRKQKVAPGLYADLGTMYLQAGNREKALANYRKEREEWPESATLMDAMIKNFEAQKSTKEAKS